MASWGSEDGECLSVSGRLAITFARKNELALNTVTRLTLSLANVFVISDSSYEPVLQC